MDTTDKQGLWEGIIKDWRDSGLSQKDYCASQGHPYSTFCYWRRKAEGRDPSDKGVGLRAVEIAAYSLESQGAFLHGSGDLELDAQGILLQAAGGEASVQITGRLDLATLGRIMAACAGDRNHAPA